MRVCECQELPLAIELVEVGQQIHETKLRFSFALFEEPCRILPFILVIRLEYLRSNVHINLSGAQLKRLLANFTIVFSQFTLTIGGLDTILQIFVCFQQ